ncbi:MFS transporter [Kineosporia sp. A_224]|uniref:MFS transporter n=1 Tax=Kineosporia sp. A_224 TaxID=1962180 RepID=UPI000B4B4DBE|nr:MFS transporter [Kineosporia sp. A_224]
MGRCYALVRGLDDAMPIYPVYALLFSETGVSDAGVAGLFALWSLAVVVLEVPSGAWGDVVARHRLVAVAGVVRAAGFAVWVVAPSYPAFLLGFGLWALGGSLISGTLESHVHDALAVHGAQGQYRRVAGRAHVASLVGMMLATASAPLLLAAGGYLLVGLASSVVCLAFAVVALRLPDPAGSGWRRAPLALPDDAGEDAPDDEDEDAPDDEDDDAPDDDPEHPWRAWWRMLRDGVREAATHPPVRRAVLLASVVWAALALDEFFPLLARTTGFSERAVPLVMLAVTAAQVVGAWAATRPGADRRLAVICLGAFGLLAAGCLAATVPAWVAISLGYGLGQAAVVLVEARIQAVVRGAARATVTSVAGLGSEVLSIGLYLTWGLAADPAGRPVATALVTVPLLLAVPLALRTPRAARTARERDGG